MIREIEHTQIIIKHACSAVNNTVNDLEKNRRVLASNFRSGVWRIEMIIKRRPRGE